MNRLIKSIRDRDYWSYIIHYPFPYCWVSVQLNWANAFVNIGFFFDHELGNDKYKYFYGSSTDVVRGMRNALKTLSEHSENKKVEL